MKHLTAFLLCLAALISPAYAQESPIANVKFAMRLADDKPGDDRIEVQVEDTDATIYLHKSSVLSSNDVVSAKVQIEDYGPQIMIELSEDGGTKMFEATSQNMGKFLAIIADGKVIVAPRIQAAISSSAAFTGDFTEAEANRLAAIIRGDDPQSAIVSPIAGKAFEMRLAWEKPGPELIEVVVGDTQRKLYLDKVLLNRSHVAKAVVSLQSDTPVINVDFLHPGFELLSLA